MRNDSPKRLTGPVSAQIGEPRNAQRITVNLAGEVALEVRRIAEKNRVSESSIIEIALRQLFRRVGPATLGAFLREHGGCLRRRGS